MPYFTHGETKYKLILLYIVSRFQKLPTRDQLYRTAVLNSEMEYFAFEDALHDLEEDGLLATVKRPFGECLGLTDIGRESLSMFEKSIPADERRRIDTYIEENRVAFAREAEISSQIEKTPDGHVYLNLHVSEGADIVFSLRLAVPGEEQAIALRSRWESCGESIYNAVWDILQSRDDGK